MKTKSSTILALNPGSTSTKIGVYRDEAELFTQSIEHSAEELAQYSRIVHQYPLRKAAILSFLRDQQIAESSLDLIVARGGLLPPISGGAYTVNKAMVDYLSSDQAPEHASNLAALIAYDLAVPLKIPALIYDGVSTDELSAIARITGLPGVNRRSLSHALNSRAAARKAAFRRNCNYYELTFIVAHLGGGISVTLHHQGRIIDLVSDDEGPFSPERAGRIPGLQLIDLCYSGGYDYTTMRRLLRGKGGLLAHLGTTSALAVEDMIQQGNQQATLIYQALAYQVAKAIGELATVVGGQVDLLILTGGLSHSLLFTDWLRQSVSFIAPVEIIPGENELESLAQGGLRVLRGQEPCRVYGAEEALRN